MGARRFMTGKRAAHGPETTFVAYDDPVQRLDLRAISSYRASVLRSAAEPVEAAGAAV